MPIPDADDESQDPQIPAMPIPPLVIGDPFAVADGVELLERVQLDEGTVARAREKGLPGCACVVKCDGSEAQPCGQVFRIDLLQPGVKQCPRCKAKYTHVLLVAPVDDDDIIADAMATVLAANGYSLPGMDESDDEEDEDDEDDQGDEP